MTSNIEADNTFKLFEASYEHHFVDARVSILVGLHDLNSEFYVLEHARLFVHSSFGNGVEVSQVGPSFFPTTALAARLRVSWASDGYLTSAVYDGIPGDPGDPIATQISIDEGDSVFVITEVGISSDEGSYYKLGLGGWYPTASYDDIAGQARSANGGFCLIGEHDVWRDEAGRGVGVFGQIGFADCERNQMRSYFGGGFTWTGPFTSRPQDIVGFAFAHARNGEEFRRLNPSVTRAETALELSYLTALTRWFTIQPNIHYVIDPGIDSAVDNALVVGVRLRMTF
ncbi:MAG: porin [Gammaproteobacteria bacterium]